jgi:catechol-2,3-dioxygenase
VELYRDRPEFEWPRSSTGELAMFTHALDLDGLLREGVTGCCAAAGQAERKPWQCKRRLP